MINTNTNLLTVENPIQESYVTTGNNRAQVIRVMNWHNLTVPAGAILTVNAWNGSSGGVMAMAVRWVVLTMEWFR